MLLEKSWIKSLAIFARFILELWCYKYFPFQDIDMLLVHCISKKRNVSMSQKKGSTYNIKALVKRKIIEICQCEKGFWVLQQKSHDFLPTFSSFFLVEHFSLEAKRTSSTSMKYVKSILKILWTLNDLRSVLICSLLYHA